MYQRKICLRALEISKSVQVKFPLENMSLTLEQGEILSVLGTEKAGKTTLLGVLSGLLQPDQGTIELYGRPVSPYRLRTAQENGVFCLYREQFLLQDLTAAENILAPSRIGSSGPQTGTECVQQAQEILNELHVHLDLHTYPALLSPYEHQVIQLARAVALRARILLADNIAGEFSSSQRQTLLQMLRQLTARGVSIIYFTDRIEDAASFSDRLCILHEGKLTSVPGQNGENQTETAVGGDGQDGVLKGIPESDGRNSRTETLPVHESRSEQNLKAYLQAATKYIDQHLSEELTPGTVAEAVHLSSGYLMMLFKNHMDTSIMEYVYKQRIEQAKIRLQSGSRKISDIACDIGIPNAQYFSVLFKKHTGMTPKEYRKACHSSENTENI